MTNYERIKTMSIEKMAEVIGWKLLTAIVKAIVKGMGISQTASVLIALLDG